MTALDDTLVEKVERLVDASGQPLRWTSSTTVVIAQLVERIESLEAAVREIADAMGAATDPAGVSFRDEALIAEQRMFGVESGVETQPASTPETAV